MIRRCRDHIYVFREQRDHFGQPVRIVSTVAVHRANDFGPRGSNAGHNTGSNSLVFFMLEYPYVFRLPEQSFLYLLYALMEREQNTRNVIHAPDWRLFLMYPEQVEEELLRLHQYGKLRFERAGTFLELTLPFEHTEDFIRSRAG